MAPLDDFSSQPSLFQQEVFCLGIEHRMRHVEIEIFRIYSNGARWLYRQHLSRLHICESASRVFISAATIACSSVILNIESECPCKPAAGIMKIEIHSVHHEVDGAPMLATYVAMIRIVRG